MSTHFLGRNEPHPCLLHPAPHTVKRWRDGVIALRSQEHIPLDRLEVIEYEPAPMVDGRIVEESCLLCGRDAPAGCWRKTTEPPWVCADCMWLSPGHRREACAWCGKVATLVAHEGGDPPWVCGTCEVSPSGPYRPDGAGHRTRVSWGASSLMINVLPGETSEQLAQRILASVHPPEVARAMADSLREPLAEEERKESK